MGSSVPTNVNRMINDLVHNLNKAPEILQGGTDALFDAYGLTAEERDALTSGSWQSMGAIGVNPIHQLQYLFFVNPAVGENLSVKTYLSRLGIEK